MAEVITTFNGVNAFLSNFWAAPIFCAEDGILYPTVEHWYQAHKTEDRHERLNIAAATTPGRAKRLGRKVQLRLDWNEIKLDVMRTALCEKFKTPHLRKALLATGNATLIEGNTWNDTFWGVCRGSGENHLGQLLMELRKELQDDTTLD